MAYDMSISDGSSYVCSSDLPRRGPHVAAPESDARAGRHGRAAERAEVVSRFRTHAWGIVVLAAIATPARAIDINGRVDEAEWAGAKHVTDFRMVEPLPRAPSPYPTEAWIRTEENTSELQALMGN